jgi:hypothetical protein
MLDRPQKIAIVFVGNDPITINKQEDQLSPIRKKYDVEIWRRSEKFSGNYSSYSQIINEGVCDTDSEFMFFINPKVSNISPNDIESMLDELISGYCWVSRVAFGLFGTTKQLFRKTGLMDERFVGNEYEDDDFLLRMKGINKAFIWKYDQERYPDNPRGVVLSPMRGCSATVFSLKWLRDKNNPDLYLLNRDYSEEKKLSPKHLSWNRSDIEESWMDGSESIIEETSHVAIVRKNAVVGLDNRKTIIARADSVIELEISENSLRVGFSCNVDTSIHVIAVSAIEGGEFTVARRKTIFSNTWESDEIESSGEIEIKIFHEGEKIYHDRFIKAPYFREIKIGLRISQKVS